MVYDAIDDDRELLLTLLKVSLYRGYVTLEQAKWQL